MLTILMRPASLQVAFVNQAIDEAAPRSPLHGLRHIEDPSDQIQLVYIALMDFFLLNRRQHLCESDIVALHEAAKSLLDILNEVLPERTGTGGSALADADSEPVGWNFWKAHSVMHAYLERLLFGWSEVTSTQIGRAHV